MKTKMLLRITSVAALACAVWSLAACSSPTTGGAAGTSTAQPVLSALSLSYDDGTPPQGFLFDKGSFYYQLDIEKTRGGALLSVTAKVDDGSTIEIAFNGGLIKNGGKVTVPATGETFKQLVITLSKAKAEPSEYKIDLDPPQSTSNIDASLASIFIGYTQTSDNLMLGINGLGGTAKSTDHSHTTAYVKAIAASSHAKIELRYGGKSEKGTGTVVMDRITLPDVDHTQDLLVLISSEDGSVHINYTIVVNGYIQNEVIWYGHVGYTGADAADMEIIGVMAMDNENNLRNAQWDKPGQSWYLTAGELYRPSFFTATMRKKVGEEPDDDGNIIPVYIYRQSKGFPLPANISTAKQTSWDKNPIKLTIGGDDIGILITTPDDLFKYLNDNTDPKANYALGSDIDLNDRADTSQDWTGPSYKGKFFGGGFTIKNLNLTNTSRDNGLFATLESDANSVTVLENFTLEVSALGYLSRTGTSRFGGAVGILGSTTASSIEIRNVMIKGKMEIGKATGSYDYLGAGLIGEIYDCKSLLIENCVSELSIDVVDSPSSKFQVAGGFIGRMYNHGRSDANITIRNSYATGNVGVVSSNSNSITAAGGLIAEIATDASKKLDVTIEQSYAAGNISATGTALTPNTSARQGAGGLIGLIHKSGSGSINLTIRDCAAVGEKALFTSNQSVQSNGRFAGLVANDKIVPVLSNNIARLGMLVGAGTASDEVGQADDAAAVAFVKISANANASAPLLGLGVAQEDLVKKSTWTETLGWKETEWDFSGLSAIPTVWPKFKKP